MNSITDTQLGYLYVLMPGETNWEKLYVIFRHGQLRFLTNIRNHAFKYCYTAFEIMIRIVRKDILVPGELSLRIIDCILVTHKFDNLCMYLTIPTIFEMDQISGESLPRFVLQAVGNKLNQISEVKHEFSDHTNRHPWGKLKVFIG